MSQYAALDQALPGSGYTGLMSWNGLRWTAAPSWLALQNGALVGTPPYPGTFLVRAMGPNGTTIAQIDVAQSVRPLAPGHQEAWFTYDADNRTVVNNGQLVNNTILATADAGSLYVGGQGRSA